MTSTSPFSIVRSWEIRWFIPRDAHDVLARRFDDAPHPETQPWRSDEYALGTGPTLGVKMREGRLELKRRLASEQLEIVGVTGELEQWVKEVYEADATGDRPSLGAWRGSIVIQKRRRVLKYRLTEDGEVEAIGPAVRIDGSGCQVELTAIRIGEGEGDAAWTIGFESFGDPSAQRAALLACVEAILTNVDAIVRDALKPSRSQGYPAWIESLESSGT